jgi:hypothetical protein
VDKWSPGKGGDYQIKVSPAKKFNEFTDPVIIVSGTDKFNDEIMMFLEERAGTKAGPQDPKPNPKIDKKNFYKNFLTEDEKRLSSNKEECATQKLVLSSDIPVFHCKPEPTPPEIPLKKPNLATEQKHSDSNHSSAQEIQIQNPRTNVGPEFGVQEFYSRPRSRSRTPSRYSCTRSHRRSVSPSLNSSFA